MFKVNIYYSRVFSVVFCMEKRDLCGGAASKFPKNFKKAGCLLPSSLVPVPNAVRSIAWSLVLGTGSAGPHGHERPRALSHARWQLARVWCSPWLSYLPPVSLQTQALSEAHTCARTHTHTHTHPPLLTDRADESLFLVITVQTTHSPGCAETLRTNHAMC